MLTNADLRALYVLAADYHSGQASRGYRLGSHIARIMRKRHIWHSVQVGWPTIRQSVEYAKFQPLAEKYF